jgi:hypothetical protein
MQALDQPKNIVDDDIHGSGMALDDYYSRRGTKTAMVGLNSTVDENPGIAGSGGIEDGAYNIIRSIMRLLQLLVEGHNYRMQV